MKFRFYFFKENTRTFDRAELFEFLNDNKYITLDTETRQSEKIAYYDNPLINLKAQFIFGEKSVVPELHKLSPKFLDLNIRLEFDVLNSDYKLNKLLNICETMCKRYQFCVYNETFNDVIPFRRSTMLKSFQIVKQAYKIENEEEFMKYSKIASDDLSTVYQYIESIDEVEQTYKQLGARAVRYQFFRKPGSRVAYIAGKWNGAQPFIIPSNLQLFIYDDGTYKKIISFKDLLKNISSSLEILEDTQIGIYILNPKHTKKVRKHIIKYKYAEVQVNLKSVDIDTIYDL